MQLMFTWHVQVFSHGSCIQRGKLPGPQYWLPKSLSVCNLHLASSAQLVTLTFWFSIISILPKFIPLSLSGKCCVGIQVHQQLCLVQEVIVHLCSENMIHKVMLISHIFLLFLFWDFSTFTYGMVWGWVFCGWSLMKEFLMIQRDLYEIYCTRENVYMYVIQVHKVHVTLLKTHLVSSLYFYASSNLLIHYVAPWHITLSRDHLVSSFTHPQTYFYTLSLHDMLTWSRTI